MNSSQTIPYQITRIRLINFHNFIDETIDLPNGGHLFLLGDNGCGKTTILDAIHYVLTAGLSMEWNAAARVAGSRHEGRRVQGIVMRYNLDTGAMHPDGGISYAALEIQGRHGKPLTIGIGMATTAMEERVRHWGVIRECPLAAVAFTLTDLTGTRPASSLEFKDLLGPGRGFYKDAKSYRQELAHRLFSDDENYLEICRFLSMGKAYREIAAHATDYHELFKSLLPEPLPDLFGRIIEALRTLDESKTLLDDMTRKLAYLEGLQTLVTAIAENREAVLRYEWLAWHKREELAENDIDKYTNEILGRQTEEAALAAQLHEKEKDESQLRSRLDDLKTRDASGLVRQEKEGQAELRRKKQDLEDKRTNLKQSGKEMQAAAALLAKERNALDKTLAALLTELGRKAARLPFTIADLLAELDQMHRAEQSEDQAPHLSSQPVLVRAEAERDSLREKRFALERQLAEGEKEISGWSEELQILKKQQEVAPGLNGWTECRNRLQTALLSPQPFYKGLEWRPGLAAGERARIEEFIGEDILATLLLPEAEYEQALAVAAGFPGVRISHPGRGSAEMPEWIRMSLDITRSDPDVLRCLAAEMISDFGPQTTRVNQCDMLSFRCHDRALAGITARLIGAAGRKEALAREKGQLEVLLQDLAKTQNGLERQLKALQESEDLLRAFVEMLLEKLADLATQARQTVNARQEVLRLGQIYQLHEQRLLELERETSALDERIAAMGRLIRQEGLEDLDRRIERVEKQLRANADTIRGIISRQGEIKSDNKKAAEEIDQTRLSREKAASARRQTEERLAAQLPDINDLSHYILRTRKGFQFKTLEAIDKERANSDGLILENRTLLRERLHDPEFGAAFRFWYEEESNRLFDYRSRLLGEIISQQGREIAEQQEIINERTKELFKKIIMTELVNYLRSHVSDLEQMLARIRKLLATRFFGGQQYRFRIRPMDKYSRLVQVIKKFSPFDPAAEEELRHFFEDRKDDIVNTVVGTVPDELDYRNWYHYEMEVATGEQGVVMDRRTKSMGSGGEQAVPNYLLILTIAHFFFHGKKVRLHLLLFDEAFYGIDAGRRDQLLGFASDLGLQLFVASPDQDGVRQEVSYSTTILIKKDTNFDVHLYPYHWENPNIIKQPGLFDEPTQPHPVLFGEESGNR
ncbi:MAG: SbcC/MukB-like Walker B domain-containing protein [Thermodesulfobacteriota bacterium]